MSESDETEAARRALIPTMPALARAEAEAGRPVWSSKEMRELFTVDEFLAPFVLVTRKADGQQGTLLFTHTPRYYFGWEAKR